MTMLAQLGNNLSSPERNVAYLATAALGGWFLWMLYRKYFRGPATPDPWGEEITQAMENDDAVPLCQYCLAPHEHDTQFCTECGGAVGPYTNLQPLLYVYSLGHVLRIGTDGSFRRSSIVVIGFILFSIAEYGLFVPFYWVRLLRNILRMEYANPPDAAPPIDGPV